MSDRPKRKAAADAADKISLAAEKMTKINIESILQAEGFGAFRADLSTHNDGREECTAYLWHTTRTSNRLKQGALVQSGAGHSEVKALCEFIRTKCAYEIDTYKEYAEAGLYIQCEDKPVCKNCATFLGLLGVQRYDAHTKKSPVAMGSTQWGIPDKRVKDFLVELLRDARRSIDEDSDSEAEQENVKIRKQAAFITPSVIDKIFS